MIAQSAAGMMWPGDQGQKNGDYQIKFLADRIVYAPFWYAQKMLSESHQPNVVGGYHELCQAAIMAAKTDGNGDDGEGGATTIATANSVAIQPQPTASLSPGCFTDWMAAVSDDGKTLVIRTENPNNVSVAFKATLASGPWASSASMVTLAGPSLDAMNDYDTPTAVAPKSSAATVSAGGVVTTTLPPFSFVVLTLNKA
jgi:hypothetical protein